MSIQIMSIGKSLSASKAMLAGLMAALANDALTTGSFLPSMRLGPTLPGPRGTFNNQPTGSKLSRKAAKGKLGIAVLR